MNTKSDSDDGLPPKKNLKLCNLIIFVSSNFFREVNTIHKFCQMNEWLHRLCKNMIRLVCLKELMLLKPVVFVNVFFHYSYLLVESFKFKPKLWNVFHALMQGTMCFNDAVITSVKTNNYRIYFWHMNKTKIMQ